jgi:hypothetical protein
LGAGIEYKDLELNPLDTNQFIEKAYGSVFGYLRLFDNKYFQLKAGFLWRYTILFAFFKLH